LPATGRACERSVTQPDPVWGRVLKKAVREPRTHGRGSRIGAYFAAFSVFSPAAFHPEMPADMCFTFL